MKIDFDSREWWPVYCFEPSNGNNKDAPDITAEKIARWRRIFIEFAEAQKEMEAAWQGLEHTPVQPSKEGLRRYPPDGYYDVCGDPTPCVCVASCPSQCQGRDGDGQCECDACRYAHPYYLNPPHTTPR